MPGGFLVYMYEILKWIYLNKIYGTYNRGDDIQLSFSLTGDKDPAAGDSLCGLDWNRSFGGSYRRDRTV